MALLDWQLGADVLAGASVEEWLWAVAVVHSRSFGVEQRGTMRHLLLPLADMLNHGGDELRDGRTVTHLPTPVYHRPCQPWRSLQTCVGRVPRVQEAAEETLAL